MASDIAEESYGLLEPQAQQAQAQAQPEPQGQLEKSHPELPPPDSDQQEQAKREPKKRKRRTVACLLCRQRKLKCDLVVPACGRCVNAGETCVYEYDTESQSKAKVPRKSNINSSNSLDGDGRSDEQRIRDLERMLAIYTAQSAPGDTTLSNALPSASGDISQDASNEPSSDASKGAGYAKTAVKSTQRFYGSSHVASLTAEFGDLKAYLLDLRSKFRTIANLHRDLDLDALREDPKKSEPGELALAPIFLAGLLPPQPVVHRLVDHYFAHIGTAYRILHRQTFYHSLQDLYQKATQQASANFIIQLLLVLSIVWTIDAPETLTPSAEVIGVTRAMALDWIRRADDWVYHANIKRPNLLLLQTRCLLILAKEANYTRKNQAWATTGATVKLAMSAGFHREALSSLLPPLDREMRRRVWAAVVELDLNASFDRGMPPTIQATDYDAVPLQNIDDIDIANASPESIKPWSAVTDASFQVILARSVDLRLRICALVNSPRVSISAAQLMDLDSEISQHLSETSYAWNLHPILDANTQQRDRLKLWRALVDTQLRRSQLCLHTCVVLSNPLPNPGSASTFASRSRLEVAMELLCAHQNLADLFGRLAWPVISDITFLAAFTICHYLHTSSSGFASYPVQAAAPVVTESLIALVEKTLPTLESKFIILEKGMREYCFFCVVIALVKSKRWPEAVASHQRRAVDRISSMCYGILSRRTSGRRETTQPQDSLSMPRAMPSGNLSSNSSETDFNNFGGWDFLLGDFTTGFIDFGIM